MPLGGTTEKCKACEKTVYPMDQLTVNGGAYHKSCFKCHHCKGTLQLGSYCSFEGKLHCKPHFEQLFKETGSFEKSFHSFKVRSGADWDSKQSGQHVFRHTGQMCHLQQNSLSP